MKLLAISLAFPICISITSCKKGNAPKIGGDEMTEITASVEDIVRIEVEKNPLVFLTVSEPLEVTSSSLIFELDRMTVSEFRSKYPTGRALTVWVGKETISGLEGQLKILDSGSRYVIPVRVKLSELDAPPILLRLEQESVNSFSEQGGDAKRD